ncbi:Innexin [Fasciola gigantica]|uniref:Innexin n=1 Tax=Fasciola gigantica TaxID=46835 RepID=A0A504YLT5_FASGI|nr:Innexin [Fasciola gigantica]
MLVKSLYLINGVGQLFMMERFLGLNRRNYTMFGLAIAHDILTGKDWEVTLVFPRVGYCLIPVRHMGSRNYVTSQCVLPVNMLNERIYVFLWFWIVLACTLTAISIPTWFVRMSYQKSRTCFIKRYLKLGEVLSRKDRVMVEKFKRQFLRHDGIFLLKMISLNAGDLICADIVCQLWKVFKSRYFFRDLTRGPEEDNDLILGQVRAEEGKLTRGGSLGHLVLKSDVKPSAPKKIVDEGDFDENLNFT